MIWLMRAGYRCRRRQSTQDAEIKEEVGIGRDGRQRWVAAEGLHGGGIDFEMFANAGATEGLHYSRWEAGVAGVEGKSIPGQRDKLSAGDGDMHNEWHGQAAVRDGAATGVEYA
jgi:hypothetical protein